MTKWKPAKKAPMIGNAPKIHLGQVQAAVPILIRWGLPFIAWAGGAYLATAILSKAVPDVPINKKNLGLASALVGGGLTSYFLSPTISEHWRPAAYAGAVAGIAAGLYFLFQEPSPPAPESPAANLAKENLPSSCQIPGSQKPNENMAPALSGIRVDLDLEQDKLGGLKRNKYADQDFAFTLRNLTNDTKCFYVGLDVRDVSGNPVTDPDYDSFPSGMSPIGPSLYARKQVTLLPGETKAETLKMPALGSYWSPVTGFNTTVQVDLFRNLRDVSPFQQSNVINVVFVPPWSAWMGQSTIPLVPIEIHDERDPYHVMGCKKCKKKKKSQPFTLPQANIVYNA